MPGEWKEPGPGRDSPLSGTSPDVCGQTGLASQDVRAANCRSRYWVFTHSQPGCFALQVIKQGNGADVYESDPCAAAPRFCTSASAPAAPSTRRAFYCCSCLSTHPALKQTLLEIAAAIPSLPPPPLYQGLNYLLCSTHLDFSEKEGKKTKEMSGYLGAAVLQPAIQNIKFLGGRGWTDRKMRKGIPKLIFSLRSLLKNILKHIANLSSQQPDIHKFRNKIILI